MCIIYATDGLDSRPTLQELKDGAHRNDDGAGYAYIDNGRVAFAKNKQGYDLASLHKFINETEGPMLIHFRWTSSGQTTATLSHPFPVTTDPLLLNATEGKADQVFMHNGTIDERLWQPTLLQTDLKTLPKGPWSDSRALAYMLAYYGNAAILDAFDVEDESRFCTLDKDGITRYGYWLKQREGLYTSTYINPPVTTKKWLPTDGANKTTTTTTPNKSYASMTMDEWKEYPKEQAAEEKLYSRYDGQMEVGDDDWTDEQWQAYWDGETAAEIAALAS